MAKRKAKRGPRGKGTVFPRGGVWVARRPVGKLPSGRTRYLERKGRTQAEAMARLAAALPPGPATTFADWAARWLAAMKCRSRTRAIRTNALNRHAAPVLGTTRVAALTARHVEDAAAKWADSLAPNTVRQTLAVLHTCLNAARRAGLIDANPVGLAEKPKGVKKKIDPFTPAELTRVVAEATARDSCRALALLAATGCRVGEALALDAAEFDPEAGTVAINRTRSAKKGEADGPPKSANGVRVIRVPRAALPAVRAAHAGRTTGPLFPTTVGTRGAHSPTRDAWVGLCKRLGLRFRSLHQLRHSAATAMLGDGVPIPDIAKYLGDTTETIVRTYLHATGADPADAMDRVLGGGKVAGKLPNGGSHKKS